MWRNRVAVETPRPHPADHCHHVADAAFLGGKMLHSVAVRDFREGGPHGLQAGEWTDDTSMALALGDSIADVGWNLDDQAERYAAWWRTVV